MLPKHFQKFFEKEAERLVNELEKNKELKSFSVDTDIADMISRATKALKKDHEEQEKEPIIVSEKTGEAIKKADEVVEENPLEEDQEKITN